MSRNIIATQERNDLLPISSIGAKQYNKEDDN